jgi:hypothetical protein
MKCLRCDDGVCADDTVGDFRVGGRVRCAFKLLAGLWESTSRRCSQGVDVCTILLVACRQIVHGRVWSAVVKNKRRRRSLPPVAMTSSS